MSQRTSAERVTNNTPNTLDSSSSSAGVKVRDKLSNCLTEIKFHITLSGLKKSLLEQEEACNVDIFTKGERMASRCIQKTIFLTARLIVIQWKTNLLKFCITLSMHYNYFSFSFYVEKLIRLQEGDPSLFV